MVGPSPDMWEHFWVPSKRLVLWTGGIWPQMNSCTLTTLKGPPWGAIPRQIPAGLPNSFSSVQLQSPAETWMPPS